MRRGNGGGRQPDKGRPARPAGPLRPHTKARATTPRVRAGSGDGSATDGEPKRGGEFKPPRAKAGSGSRPRISSGRGSARGEGPAKTTETSLRPAQAAAKPAEAREAAPSAVPLPTGVQILSVEPDEAGMRLDRFLLGRFPGLAQTHIQRIVRKGEVRVSGHRAKPSDRLEAGWGIRVPPLKLDQKPERPQSESEADEAFLRSLALFEDDDMLVINKPFGLAVQGGSGMTRHVDGLLESMRSRDGQKPRLVHRLDKDTAGCLVIAKTRFAAAALAKSFRSRTTRKIYWAIVAGVPRVRQGRVSTYLARGESGENETRMEVARHGDDGASHALTYYAVIDQAAQKLAWLSLKPVTGRTHQLRAHAAHIGHPIVGDPKYFDVENWELPGGIQNRLHLLARRIVVPHPRTGRPVDVTAPLPPHMQQTFNLLGLDVSRYDPIEESPEA
ncbi:RluA family pseudouridine synthase [Enterovirga rhinocerotis]|uniref:Ribosomal large subunit pseudouridine synthase D n=1 Tax=Enterovirga rhinocerotis TaxID=1339210 RepID=A0A4R7CC28_9HYPH|nr:23S rRNA pseudouridine955/2504/2580 synthase [Enterovirga rhinocerotis]